MAISRGDSIIGTRLGPPLRTGCVRPLTNTPLLNVSYDAEFDRC